MTSRETALRLATAPLRRRLRRVLAELLPTPMKQVFRELDRRGIRTSALSALELFGATGESHTIEYASRVRSLEVWEIRPAFEAALRRNFPSTTIRITDSYEEMKRTAARFDLIVIDNPASTFGPDRSKPESVSAEGEHVGDHCEHFDVFPDVFRLVADAAILVLNVIPEASETAVRQRPYLFHPGQLARRRDFYGAEDAARIPIEQMVKGYERLCTDNGFRLDWWFSRPRTYPWRLFGEFACVHYLVLGVRRALD